MKKIFTFTILCIFSMVLINCSASPDSSNPKSAPNANSAEVEKKPVAQPSPADDGKSDADKMDDGKSDADRTNSNR